MSKIVKYNLGIPETVHANLKNIAKANGMNLVELIRYYLKFGVWISSTISCEDGESAEIKVVKSNNNTKKRDEVNYPAQMHPVSDV